MMLPEFNFDVRYKIYNFLKFQMGFYMRMTLAPFPFLYAPAHTHPQIKVASIDPSPSAIYNHTLCI
jgi:hypothetical protein